MKDRKTELKWFSIPEWEKEEKYLREQHKNGWEFVNVNFIGLYHFKKCDPKDVVYQLDYNPESVTQKDESLQIFRDCGWEYLQNFFGYSYFRKPASEMHGEEEIFCDDASRLDMMKRVFKQRMLPLLCIFFVLIVPNIFIQGLFDAPVNHILLVTLCIMFGLYLGLFIAFGIQFWKYLRSNGGC